jgi:cephalosporin-C deacetylase-like acetyl esterase
MKSLCLAWILALLLVVPASAQESDALNVLSGLGEFSEIRKMLPSYLKSSAERMLAERQRQIDQLSTLEDVAKRKADFRQRLLSYLGGLPERTPLNARVVGVLEREAYRIEKVVFESQPRFYVTANLYLPKTGRPPYPAILYPLGHERGAKANPVWQQMLGSLASKGFVALAWDPIGQGERVQFYDEDLQESKVGNSTTEHTEVGIQCLLVGDHMARYTIWDGMRALDYLLSRTEVDPTRVGITGNSGGGTHTAYLAALDDRIHVAAPSCYITSWHLMLQTIGPQDAEQAFPFWLQDGFDYPDFLYAFAPKPYLILSAIRDFFPISGARQTYAEAERAYSAMGAKEKLGMFEADDGHGYSKPRRLAAYRWLSRWLKGVEDNEPEREIEPVPAEDLWCTPTGQVSTSRGGETVFSLNKKRWEQLKAKGNLPLEEVRRRVRKMSGFEPTPAPLQVRSYGTIARPAYHIEKLVYDSEPGIMIPALLFVPEQAKSKKPAILYVDGSGKSAAASDAEQLVKSGFVVLAIDARGCGETKVSTEIDSDEFDRYFGDYNNAMTALLIGKTLVGMRARDITRGIDLLVARSDVDHDQIYGFGKDAGAVPMLYAAVLDERLRKVGLEGMLVSYESVVLTRIHRGVLEDMVPRALQVYDLPDLVAALAPREVWLVNATDPLRHQVGSSRVKGQYARASQAFKLAGAESALRLRDRRPDESMAKTYPEMMGNP